MQLHRSPMVPSIGARAPAGGKRARRWHSAADVRGGAGAQRVVAPALEANWSSLHGCKACARMLRFEERVVRAQRCKMPAG